MLSLAVVILGIAAACGDSPVSVATVEEAADPTPIPTIQIVTTSNVVADWVRRVGGDRVEVLALLPVGSSPHGHQPGARDVTRIAEADLVFEVGLLLEVGWMDELMQRTASDRSKIVTLGELIDPIPFAEHDDHDEHGEEDGHDDHDEHGGEDGHDEHGEEDGHDEHGHEGHTHGELDPHFWLDPLRVKVAVDEIAARLSAVDTDGSAEYTQRANAYKRELDHLHAQTLEALEALPHEARKLVTSHDSFGYFAELYEFEIVGAVIPSGTTEREATPRELADLIDLIEAEGVRALFGETIEGSSLVEQVARETGVRLETGLYTGSLGATGSGAESYLTMFARNVELIVQALQ